MTENVGTTREGSLEKLRNRLCGDLDNIVLRAMRKEPNRRYASVGQFSEDIRRHLVGLPVIARPDTFRYRAAKFVQRHKVTAAGAVIVFLTLVGGIVYNNLARLIKPDDKKRLPKPKRNALNDVLTM